MHGFRGLLATGFAFAVVASIFWGWFSWTYAWQVARSDIRDRVEVIAKHVERLVQTQTAIHVFAAQSAGAWPQEWIGSRAFHDALAAVDRAHGFTLGTAVLTLDGEMLASSRMYPVDGVRLEGRSYVEAVRSGRAIDIDRLLTQPGDGDAIVVASPFQTPAMSGVIVSAIDTGEVQAFLANAAVGRGQTAGIIRSDGKLLLRNVPSEPMMLDPGLWSQAARLGYAQGLLVAQSDGVRRLQATTRVGSLPLLASYGIPVSGIVSSWLWWAAPVWVLLFALMSAMALVSRAAWARLRLQHQLDLSQRAAGFAEEVAAQKTTLMQEAHHRIKNNLALVASLIRLQQGADGMVDGRTLRARVEAIADVHELLQRAADDGEVDLAVLLDQIAGSPAILPPHAGIALKRQLDEPVRASSRIAVPVALIATELLLNTVKHAFEGRAPGTITVSLAAAGGRARMVVADDGRGIEGARRNAGRQIVDALVAQIDGALSVRTVLDVGTRYELTFPLDGPQATEGAAPAVAARAPA